MLSCRYRTRRFNIFVGYHLGHLGEFDNDLGAFNPDRLKNPGYDIAAYIDNGLDSGADLFWIFGQVSSAGDVISSKGFRGTDGNDRTLADIRYIFEILQDVLLDPIESPLVIALVANNHLTLRSAGLLVLAIIRFPQRFSLV